MTKNPTFIDLAKLRDDPQIQRNFLCPEYNDCLTDAAVQDVDLHCLDCPLKEIKEDMLISDLKIAGRFINPIHFFLICFQRITRYLSAPVYVGGHVSLLQRIAEFHSQEGAGRVTGDSHVIMVDQTAGRDICSIQRQGVDTPCLCRII